MADRSYPWKGEQFVSVTTVLDSGIPKPGLMRWAAKQVAETAARERKRLADISQAPEVIDYLMSVLGQKSQAAATGSTVHALAACRAFGTPTSAVLTAEEEPYLAAFEQFLTDWNPIYFEAECPVFNRTHRYAGTLDAIVGIDDKLYVMDIKTGKGIWPEAALQVSAYAHAEFIGRRNGIEEPLPKIKGGLVLHLRPEGYSLIPVVMDDNVFEVFLSALDIHHWMKDMSKYVIGAKKEKYE